MKFTNPRLRAEFDNWPSGRNRVKCVFTLEFKPGRGWKFFRVTTGKPKGDIAYGREGAIVDGDDGRTYLIQRAWAFDMICIYSSNMKSAHFGQSGDNCATHAKPELYAELNRLIDEAQTAG